MVVNEDTCNKRYLEVRDSVSEIKADVKLIKGIVQQQEKSFSNHLEHHYKYTFFAWTTAVGLIITLIIMIIKNVHL